MADTFPLTIYEGAEDDQIVIETEWSYKAMSVIIAKIDGDEITFDQTNSTGSRISGSGDYKNNSLSIIYNLDGVSYRIIATK